MPGLALQLQLQPLGSPQAHSQAFYGAEILPWISLIPGNKSHLRTTPVITYFLTSENLILVYVALFILILSLWEREANFYVSMMMYLYFFLLRSFTKDKRRLDLVGLMRSSETTEAQ